MLADILPWRTPRSEVDNLRAEVARLTGESNAALDSVERLCSQNQAYRARLDRIIATVKPTSNATVQRMGRIAAGDA